MRPNFFHHLHPPTIPSDQSRWRYTLGAGGMAVLLVLVLAFTGILEMFFYEPNPEQAALSVQRISYLIPFGGLIRNLHYWAGQLLVLVSGIHLMRVVFTGAYTPPRRFNYLLGLGLFLALVLDDFTGYILRWDQEICYALVTGTNLIKTIPGIGNFLFRLIVGGPNACETALLRFYNWHAYGLQLLAIVLTIWHLFRVRRDGGIAVPPPEHRSSRARITRFELARREGLAALLSFAGLILLASIFPAPIAPPILDQATAMGEAHAPWFFLWVQQLLKWGDPFLCGIVVPAIFLGLLVSIPYIFPQPEPAELGQWFPPSGRAAQVVGGAVLLVVLVLTLLAWVG